MSFVITGASGQLARGVIEHALAEIEPSDLILVTRSPDALREYASHGATVRHGDFNEPASLAEAFSGGSRMLLISTDTIGERVDGHLAAIDAAAAAGVELVAYTSMVNPVADNPAIAVPDHRATEQKLQDSGIAWTFLRNSLYAELQENSMAAAAGSGVLATNEGSGRAAYVARDDCAAAAAAVLTGGDHAGNAYEITGPELVDAAQRAELFSEIAGKTVELIHLDDEAYARGMADATGMPVEAARGVATFGAAIRGGYLEVLSSDFETLTGRQAQGLRSVLASRDRQ